MDQIIEKPKHSWQKISVIVICALVVMSVVYQILKPANGRMLKVDYQDISIAEVFQGNFEDSVRIRANVEPLDTQFIDAIEGGRVERVLAEDGEMVEAGKLLLELSNPSVQIAVIRSDADTTQQLNNIRTLELQLEQNRLSHKRNLIDIDYNIALLNSKIKRLKPLVKEYSASESELEELEIQLNWYMNRRDVTVESQKTDSEMQAQQLKQLQKAGEQLQRNLQISQKNQESLSVRAPIQGILSDFNAKVGAAISSGSRIGRIDIPNRYKLVSEVPEFYIGRVRKGQNVTVELNHKEYSLPVSKVYSQVFNNKFKIDIDIDIDIDSDIDSDISNNKISGLRRGQTIQARLDMSEATSSLMVEKGSFYLDTGGSWVFVLTEAGNAEKRLVELGRQNSLYIEVVSGLVSGERIVISSYANYEDFERLDIQG